MITLSSDFGSLINIGIPNSWLKSHSFLTSELFFFFDPLHLNCGSINKLLDFRREEWGDKHLWHFHQLNLLIMLWYVSHVMLFLYIFCLKISQSLLAMHLIFFFKDLKAAVSLYPLDQCVDEPAFVLDFLLIC